VLKGFGYNHRDYNQLEHNQLEHNQLEHNQLEHNQLEQPVVAYMKRIMLIDSSLDVSLLLKIALEEKYRNDSKLEVDIFTNPLAALDNFRTGLYDLIITATVMPNINGFEVYIKLRELDDKVKVCFWYLVRYTKKLQKKCFLN
jgi:PleD family two-component response regulator